MRYVHIATQLHFQSQPFSVDHGEDEVIYRHLSIANKYIGSVATTHMCEMLRADHVVIRYEAFAGISHYDTSASFFIINKSRLLSGIGRFQIGNLIFSDRTEIRFDCLHYLAIDPFVFNETGIIPLLTFICFCKYLDKHANLFSHYKYSTFTIKIVRSSQKLLTTLKLMTL